MLLRKDSTTPLTTDDMDNNLNELSLRVLPSGDQSIGGTKTFNVNPDVPALPGTDYSNNLIQLDFLKNISSEDTIYSTELPILTSNPTNMKYWIINDVSKTVLKWNGSAWTDILNPTELFSNRNGTSAMFNNVYMFFGYDSSIGTNTYFKPFVQDGAKLYRGFGFYFIKKSDGTLWGCGDNSNGQLGLGDFVSRPTLTKFDSSFDNIIDISSSEQSTIFHKADGTLWVCGNNWAGHFGTGSYGNNYSTPVQLDASFNNAHGFKMYTYNLYIEKSDGTVWGCSYYGNGNGELTIRGQFTSFQLLPDVPSIDKLYLSTNGSNNNFVYFEKSDGTVWRCGVNYSGQLGQGNTNNGYYDPIQLDNSFTNPNKISVGGSHVIIEKSDGTLWGTGANGNGQLVLGDFNSRYVFTQIPGILNPSNIVCTEESTIFEKSDGSLWFCGSLCCVTNTSISTPRIIV
jgi:hypothetical protein